MAETPSPVTCVTCRQPVPEATERLRYFTQSARKPEADAVANFLEELDELTGFLETLFNLLAAVPASALSAPLLAQCHHLGWALAEETRQRVQVAAAAWEVREQQCTQQTQAGGPQPTPEQED